MTRALSWALGAFVLTLAGSGSARTTRVELRWRAPASCPSAEVVQERTERILNRPLDRDALGVQTLRVEAHVTPPRGAGQPWTVELESDHGTRRLQAGSCNEVANATALFVAILVEPEGAPPAPTSLTDDSPNDGEPEGAPPAPTSLTDDSPDDGEREPVTAGDGGLWSITGTVGTRSGVLPTWSAGFGLGSSFSWSWLLVDAGISAWLPTSETVDADQGQGADFLLLAPSAELCLRLAPSLGAPHATSPFDAALCSGGELSMLRARGFGAGVAPRTEWATFWSATAGAKLAFALSERTAAVVDADAVVPLGDRRFVLSGSHPAFVSRPSVGVRLFCGVKWAL